MPMITGNFAAHAEKLMSPNITVQQRQQRSEHVEEQHSEKRVEDTRPCEKCRQFYFDPLYDEETEIA